MLDWRCRTTYAKAKAGFTACRYDCLRSSQIHTYFLSVFGNDTSVGGDAASSSNPGKGWSCSREGQSGGLAYWGEIVVGLGEVRSLDCDAWFMWIVCGGVLLVGEIPK